MRGRKPGRFWTGLGTLTAALSLGAMAIWLLSPRDGRGASPKRREGLQVRLAGVAGGERVRSRDLGNGIVEVFGTASDPATVAGVLAALTEEPKVRHVLNRVWTPASAAARSPDLAHLPSSRSAAHA